MRISDRNQWDELATMCLLAVLTVFRRKAETDSLPTAALCVRVRRRPRDRG